MIEQIPVVAPNSPRVLIIEDSVFCSEALKELLKKYGFSKITIMNNANSALQFLSEKVHTFDLIFTDYRLPEMNGCEFAHQYRQIIQSDTPIICCSSEIETIRKQCIEAGIDDFISKPLTTEQLEEILECWLPHFILDKDHST